MHVGPPGGVTGTPSSTPISAATAPKAPGSDALALSCAAATRRPNWSPDRFALGANLPWIDYGQDFGANAWQPGGGLANPARQARLEAAMGQLQAAGVTRTRWFMLTDGRAGIRFAPDGTPLGLDDHFFADVDAAVAAARRHGIQITFALVDFGFCAPGKTTNGVTTGGHADVIADPRKRAAFIRNVLTPIFERYGHDPGVEAWDLMNEPEWVTRGRSAKFWQGSNVDAMQGFLRDAAAAAHAHAAQPVTVGLASARGLSLVRGLGLDFYQVHWYEHWYNRLVGVPPLEIDIKGLHLDAPVVLGEYGTRSTSRSPQQILDAARKSGYAGAFAWSLGASDPYTDPAVLTRDLARWSRAHTEAIAPPTPVH